MYRRMLILGGTGLLLVWGTYYLLFYAVYQQVTRERERQDKAYWGAFNAIEHFGESADKVSERDAQAALDAAHHQRLGKNRESILQNYFQDLQRCYLGAQESCKKVNADMNEAILAPTATAKLSKRVP